MKNRRRKTHKKILMLIVAAVWLSSFSLTVLAEEGKKISKVSLTVDSDIASGSDNDEVTVNASSNEYYVDEVRITNEPDGQWSKTERPKVEVILEAYDDYYFISGFSKSKVSISGAGGSVTSVSRPDRAELVVELTLNYVGKEGSLTVDNLYWNGATGIARWDKNSVASKYEVRLYRDGGSVTSTVTTSSRNHDFSKSITKEGDYTFRVRGVDGSAKGTWVESESWYVSADKASQFKNHTNTSNSQSSGSKGPGGGVGYWRKDEVGWWYQNPDGGYTINNWQLIDKKWYFFDERGYRKSGWILWNSKWYYCGSDGIMWANTYTPDNYWVNESGEWVP